MRGVLIAVGGIVLLTAGAMAYIYSATEGTPPAAVRPPPAVDEAPPPEAPPPALPPPPSAPSVAIPGVDATRGEFTPAPAREKPEAGTWGAVPMASRARKLGTAGGALESGLLQLAPAVSGCFAGNLGSMDDEAAGVPTLVLHLETGTDQVTIVDAIPTALGGASDELFKCAIGALKGRIIKAPGQKPGQRHRLLYNIRP